MNNKKRNDASSRLSRLLRDIREQDDPDSIEFLIGKLRELLKKSNLSLKDVDLSEEKLDKKLAEVHKKEALKWLKIFREGEKEQDGRATDFVPKFREHLKKARLSLKDLGTTKKEVSGLVAKAHKIEAQRFLKIIRDTGDDPDPGESNPESYLPDLYKHLKKAGCSLEDIGSSEEEIGRISINYHKAQAFYLLLHLMQGKLEFSEDFILAFTKYLRKAGCSLKTIGTSEKKLINFLADLRVVKGVVF